jgi:superfamily II DNA helicase RecQ
MAYRFLMVPVHDPRAAEAELNEFLRSHRVLSVERRLIESGSSPSWAFCVDYLESSGGPPAAPKDGGRPNRVQIDYRERLNPDDFAVFAKLREVRKQIAQAEAVPVYTVFTNEQLAQMVQSRATTRAALEKVTGVGEARAEKYGPRVLEFLRAQWNGDVTDAPSGPPV